ncbi:MAG: hypothetical protein A07HB70_00463 [uncultured archaeon A07HB70]|nr:MAG: hypothetical protein A07HB70_00463 [uncultured archaeon A07HB70]
MGRDDELRARADRTARRRGVHHRSGADERLVVQRRPHRRERLDRTRRVERHLDGADAAASKRACRLDGVIGVDATENGHHPGVCDPVERRS